MEYHVVEKQWANALARKIERYIHRGDCVNLWGLPAVGRSGQIAYIRQTVPPHIKFLSIETKGLTNVTPSGFFSLTNTFLESLLDKRVEADPNSPSITTKRYLEQITKKYKICLVIDSLEFLTPLDDRFFQSLKALRDQFLGSLTFLFVSERPLPEHPRYLSNREFLDFACQIKVLVKPLSDELAAEGIPLLLSQYEVKLTSRQVKELLKLSGGIIGLFRSILRVLENQDEVDLSTETLLKDSHINTRLERIFNSFSDEEKDILSKISANQKIGNIESEYLANSGIIEHSKIKSKLFEAFVKKQGFRYRQASNEENKLAPKSTQMRIDFQTGEIFKMGRRLSGFLSKEESKVLRLLIEKGTAITTREEVAKALWDRDVIEKYSDWAIDKCISRIRVKIEDTARPYKYLATIKGRGFKLYSIPKIKS